MDEEDDDVSDTEAGQHKNPIKKRKRGKEEDDDDDDLSDTETGQLKNPITKRIRGTEEEHGLFLDRLKKRGRGDEKMISQVASYAHAYFDKIEKSEEKDKRSNTTSVDQTENVTNDLGAETFGSDDDQHGSCPGV